MMITTPSPESLRTDPSESLKVAGSNKGWYEIGAGSANEQVARLNIGALHLVQVGVGVGHAHAERWGAHVPWK